MGQLKQTIRVATKIIVYNYPHAWSDNAGIFFFPGKTEWMNE
jgi:hypothetical protein